MQQPAMGLFKLAVTVAAVATATAAAAAAAAVAAHDIALLYSTTWNLQGCHKKLIAIKL